MAEYLKLIPTEDLIDKAARSPLEKAIARSGFFLALGLTAASWIVVFCYFTSKIIPGLFLCMLASILVPVTISSTTKFLSEFRGRDLLRDLDRRFGLWNIPAYIRYYQERLGPGEIRCVFSGHALPNGRRYSGCIEIDDNGKMSVEATSSHDRILRFERAPWSAQKFSIHKVAAGKCAEISELVEKSKGTGTTRFHTFVKDGFPAWVAVIFGDCSEPTVISSNLSGLSSEQQRDDRIRLLRLVKIVVCNNLRFGPGERPSGAVADGEDMQSGTTPSKQ